MKVYFMCFTSKFLLCSIYNFVFILYIRQQSADGSTTGLTNTACSSSCTINCETELPNRKEDNLNIPSGSNDSKKHKERCLQDITNNFIEITGVRRKNVINNGENYK